ncbi:MAG: trehalose-6-phosphate synthase [Vicinamibacterales bacterium]
MNIHPLIVLANRAPVRHVKQTSGALSQARSASGLVTAVEPVVARASGTWIAHGDEADLDATRDTGHISVETNGGAYRLRYVPVDPSTYDGFYRGFSNEALWPLCHLAKVAPRYRTNDFAAYTTVNRRFAAAVAREARGTTPTVLVQDYHFALAPRLIRSRVTGSAISLFWHIPWPHARVFRTCPWAQTLLEGVLGSDAIGVQTDEDRQYLLNAVALLTSADIDRRTGDIFHGGHLTRVRVRPVGIDWTTAQEADDLETCRDEVRRDLGTPPDARLVVGIDRMDYSKGIPEKFAAFEHLLERRPDLRGSLVLAQVAEPSRDSIDAYRQARQAAAAACRRINERFGRPAYQPARMLERHYTADEVRRLYRAADVCWVNSLGDGMNLVAKEFAAARTDERGVLLLSEFAGASRQLLDALLVNPFAPERAARMLERALQMPVAEQMRRMRAMRHVVSRFDCRWWAARLLRDVARIAVPRADYATPYLEDGAQPSVA